MRKIFGIFLFLILVFHTSPTKSLAASVNPRNADKCYYCPQITVDGFTYDGIATNLGQCLPEYSIYPSPGGDECTNQDENYVGAYVCQYNPTNGTGNGHKYMTLANFPTANGGKCTSTQTCVTTKGCQDTGSPDPGLCGIPSDESKPCNSQFDCKNNDLNCSENWCVDKTTINDGTPGIELFTEDDYSYRPEVGACKHSATTPNCPSGENCDSDTFTGDGPPKPNTPLSQPCTDADDKWGCLKINTALGNVDTQAPEFVRWVLSFVLGVSGAVVLIIIIITGYRLMTSQGDPEKVKNAREALTAAIVGLLFIIFSLVILQFITVNVLQLPGFGS